MIEIFIECPYPFCLGLVCKKTSVVSSCVFDMHEFDWNSNGTSECEVHKCCNIYFNEHESMKILNLHVDQLLRAFMAME